MELAASLHAEARATNERRLLVLSGDADRTRELAASALRATDIDPESIVSLGSLDGVPGESIPADQSHRLLGTTTAAVVVDCHRRCEPNALGRATGTVAGGGLLVLLTPPLDVWPARLDAFNETLAVPPFDTDDVTGYYRQRLVETLRAHPGIALVTVSSDTETEPQSGVEPGGYTIERDGRIERGPECRPPNESSSNTTVRQTPRQESAFPQRAYEACLTEDQRRALVTFERLRDSGQALVVESHRGRGKSSMAGLASACLAHAGLDILVTAPTRQSAREVFIRAEVLLGNLGTLVERDSQAERGDSAYPREVETTTGGTVRFEPPAHAATLPGTPDRVVVDEAAGLPVDCLRSFLDADSVAFLTTVHGYEGAGRGFSVRFKDHLQHSAFECTECRLSEPIRYAAGDPVEVWSFRALALDARPPVDQLVADATSASCTYRELSGADLCADEHLLAGVFGLLVLAHYRTEPNDLARLLDAPNVSVHALLHEGHPVSVALLAREGNLPASTCRHIYEGGAIRGNLLPDLLGSQLRDEQAPRTVGHRVLRIATHDAVRSRGLGSMLLDRVREWCDGDWVGAGFGATPPLLSFWETNGFRTIHLGTSRDERSGEHSALMLDPLTARGERLLDRHSAWFRRRLPATLADSLSVADPDTVRAVCRTVEGTPALNLSAFEWRIAAGIPFGAAVHETTPRPVRRLAFRALCDPATTEKLTPREERLLVMRTLQHRPVATVADALSYPSERQCLRALGAAVETLVEQYGTELARAEMERLR